MAKFYKVTPILGQDAIKIPQHHLRLSPLQIRPFPTKQKCRRLTLSRTKQMKTRAKSTAGNVFNSNQLHLCGDKSRLKMSQSVRKVPHWTQLEIFLVVPPLSLQSVCQLLPHGYLFVKPCKWNGNENGCYFQYLHGQHTVHWHQNTNSRMNDSVLLTPYCIVYINHVSWQVTFYSCLPY